MPSLLGRLKNLKLFQWTVGYAATAWLLIQAIDLVGGQFAWPAAVIRGATVLLGFGVLAVAVVAWYHGERGVQRVTRGEAVLLAIVAVAAVAAVTLTARSSTHAAASPAVSPADDAATEPSFASVAVLPFTNLSGDPSQEYFSDGITEELLNALANMQGLRVPARTSSFAFKGRDEDVRHIAEALGVAHVLEGSVRRDGSRIRINAQLVSARDGYHVWSQTYDRDLAGVFEVQEEIARAIAGSLSTTLLPPADAPLLLGSTKNPEAHDAYLRGLAAMARRSPDGVTEAISALEEAVRLDPRFARAHSALAQAYVLAPEWRGDDKAAMLDPALASARKALELEPRMGEPEAIIGSVLELRFDWAGAEQYYQAAVRKEPNSAFIRHWRSVFLRAIGRPADGLADAELAVALDPLSPMRYVNVGNHLIIAGEYDRAIETLHRAIEIDPQFSPAYLFLGDAHLFAGRYEEAERHMKRTLTLRGESDAGLREVVYAIAAARGAARGAAGVHERALALLAEWEGTRGLYHSRYYLAVFYFLLGEREDMYRVMEAGVEAREVGFPGLRAHALFSPLRNEPRFLRLVTAMNLPPPPAGS